MMNAYLIFLLFFVKFGVDAAASVTLDGVDSSIVLSGYWTRANSPVTVQCAACTIDFLGQFTNGTAIMSTNFQIIGNNVSVNSRNYVGNTLFTFSSSLITIYDTSTVMDYTLYFKRVDSNDAFYRNAVKSLHLIPRTGSVFYSANASSSGYSITVTVQPTLYLAPSFALWPTNQITSGCEYYLYTSGYPSAAGASKYLVYTFTTSNRPRFTKSQIPAYAATIYVPPNCPLSLTAEDYTNKIPSNYILLDNPINGFVMSNDYPGWLTTTTYSTQSINISFSLSANVSGYKDTKFTAYVPRYDAGNGVQSSFIIAFDNDRITFNGSSSGYSNNFKSTSMKVQFAPRASQRASFLLQWGSMKSNEAHQFGLAFISLFIFCRLYQ